MTSAKLLAKLESLSHVQRQKHIIELGRDPANTGLFDALETGATSYERRWALVSCYTSRNGERILRMLLDRSRRVRGLALKLLPMVGTDEQVLQGTASATIPQLRAVLLRLRKQRRPELVDTLVRRRFAEQRGEAVESLVGFASPACAEDLLKKQFDRASGDDLRRLVCLHPEMALRHALKMAQGMTVQSDFAPRRANVVLESAHAFGREEERQLALSLVRELQRVVSLRLITLDGLYLYGCAREVAEMVLASGERVKLDWSARAEHLPVPMLLEIVQSQTTTHFDWRRILKRVPHATKAALYEQFHASWGDRKGVIPLELLALLPRSLRQKEGRRHLELANLKATPALWLPYLALLPAEEAADLARPFLGDPDPAFRAAALAAVVSNARYERGQISTVLELLEKRANEQDPVRMAMLGALAGLPPSIFQAEHLPSLARLQRQALDARDLSYMTASSLERLVASQLTRHPEWVGVQMAELLKERGSVSYFYLEERISDEEMRALGPRLEPLFRAWAVREHAPFLLALGALGRRLKVWDAGAQLLVDFLSRGPNEQLPAAASILAQHRPDLWRELAPRLLKADESWALQPVMSTFLARHRQDLLSPAILGRRLLKGRFASGNVRQLLPFSGDFWKWTPAQQALFAQTLGEMLGVEARDSPGAFYAIYRLCELPDVRPTLLLEQAQLSNPQVAWREAALRVLARLDGGEGIPTLLEALDDERARIAIYGLRKALLEMPAAQALALLRGVSMQKVTVAKEVVRLLGELTMPEAFALLLEIGERDLHRDVRVALLRGLWDHLEDPRSWVILDAAAQHSDPAVATMAARTTHPRISPKSRRRLNEMLAKALQHPDSRVRLEVLKNGVTGTISDPQGELLEPLLRCLESPVEGEYAAAARAIWTTYSGDDVKAMRAVVTRAVETLLPHRRALWQVLASGEWAYGVPLNMRQEIGRTVMGVLSRDDVLLPLQLTVGLETVTGGELRALVERYVAEGRLHEGALSTLISNIEVSSRTAMLFRTASAEWQAASSPLLRRLALAVLIGEATGRTGWTEERQARLREFRRDPSPYVAGVAQFTFWPGEEG